MHNCHTIRDQPLELNGTILPVGTTVVANSYALHHNPAVWPDPERFDPERFLDGATRDGYSFMPFSIGARNCIGQNFAQNEIKIAVACILQHLVVLEAVDHPPQVGWRGGVGLAGCSYAGRCRLSSFRCLCRCLNPSAGSSVITYWVTVSLLILALAARSPWPRLYCEATTASTSSCIHALRHCSSSDPLPSALYEKCLGVVSCPDFTQQDTATHHANPIWLMSTAIGCHDVVADGLSHPIVYGCACDWCRHIERAGQEIQQEIQ